MKKPFVRSFVFFALIIFLTIIGRGGAQTASGSAKAEVEHMLRVQQQAWNRHDLDSFMAGYWNSPELTFFSGGKEYDGWQAAMDRYRSVYARPGHEMGKLEFSALRIEMLGADAAFVRGAWQVTMSDGKRPTGYSR